MPFAVAPLIGALISTAVGTGIGFLENSGGPSSADTQKQADDAAKSQAEQDAKRQAAQEAATKAQLLRKASPDAQAQTGGSLTDAPFAALTSNIAGIPGDIQEALRLLGHGGGTGSGDGSQQSGLSGGF